MKRAVFLTPLLVFLVSCKDAPVRTPGTPDAAPVGVPQNGSSASTAGRAAHDPPARPADCPAFSRSARIASQPIADGAEVVFWTSDDTAMLRRRVSTLALPSVAQSADFRTDNIHNGIRLVFVSDDAKEVVPLRLAVHDYAKDIAARCGVAYAPPKAPKKRADPTSAGTSSSSVKAATVSKSPIPEVQKSVKPTTSSSAAPPAPKPSQAPAPSPKKPSAPITDPFAPPPPSSPRPPSNPFK
ncbi:MAG: hypothetical protein HOV80_33055 [Polyangiaceae bacterium]|nr:hypothetical protein [Polyangiaceae bacterium]